MSPQMTNNPPRKEFRKAPSGIAGLDHILYGGLPEGRPTLVCGGPGCGKTVLAMEFLVRGIQHFDQPGLFISCEESVPHLLGNFSSMKFDLEGLIKSEKLKLLDLNLDPSTVIETGSFSLDGLFIQIDQAVKTLGAKRIVLDTVGRFFTVLSDSATLRGEMSRLFDWLSEKGLTAVITGEKGAGELTRFGLEAYVSDCVIYLDHRVTDQISKRRLRVVKYRGSEHGLDEYPFIIGEQGISVIPITSATLDHQVDERRVSTGIESLDDLMGSKGYYRGSTVLVTGKAGSGKSSLSAAFLSAACQRGERTMMFAFEESPSQILRNMRSVGIDLQQHLDAGLLEIVSFRPSLRGLEEHIVTITSKTDAFQPTCVVMDPISGLINIGSQREVKSMLTRILDQMKSQGITLLLTSLTSGSMKPVETESEVSSLMDTWIALDTVYDEEEHARILYIIKSRGMDHVLSKRQLVITSDGIRIQEYPEGLGA